MINVKKELKKNVASIHCTNTLSLLQRKISNALLFHAYPNLKAKEEHEVSLKKLCEIIGYIGHNTDAIKIAIRKLITTLVEWNIIDEIGQEDWTASTILASVRLYAGTCIYAYSPRMRDLLFSPKMYGKINIFIQSKFNSSYGLALYENCVRYQGLPQTKWFDFKIFRKLMGVPQDKYPIFRDFNKRVILKAVEEVNIHSDLYVEPDIKRQGRTIEAIRFKLCEKDKQKVIKKADVSATITRSFEQQNTLDKLRADFLISQNGADEILKLYDLNYVNDKIQLIENSKLFKEGKVTNLAGYLLSALKDDYQETNSNTVLIFRKNKAAAQAKDKSEQHEQISRKYQKYIMDQIEKFIQSLNENKKILLESNFITNCIDKDIFTRERLHKFGMGDFMIKSLFKNYIRENFEVNILSFQDWLNTHDKSNDI